MKVRGTLAALAVITTALTFHHGSPQVDPQPVDNSQAVTAGSLTQDDMFDLRQQRASRSRSVASPSPFKTRRLIDKPKKPTTHVAPRSKSPSKPTVTRNSHSSVSKVGWAHTRSAYRVANCESGDRSAPDVNTRYNGNPHLRGKYSGKWQMDSDFWRTYGGLKYASTAADASETEQDAVAYKGYQARGWQPWSCSRIMGVR